MIKWMFTRLVSPADLACLSMVMGVLTGYLEWVWIVVAGSLAVASNVMTALIDGPNDH